MNLISLIQAIIRGAWRRRLLIVMPLLIIIPLSLVTALMWPTKYETNALVLLQEYNGLSGDVPAYVRAQDLRDKVKSLEALITSEFILRRVMKKFQATKGATIEPTENDLRFYRKRLKVEQVGTQFVQLKLSGGRKEGLGNELAAIMAALFESLLSSNDTSLNATAFLLRTRRQELESLEDRLKRLETSGQSPDTVLTRQRSALEAVTTRIAELQPIVANERQALDQALSVGAPNLGLTGKPPVTIIATLKSELSQMAQPNAKPYNVAEREARISNLQQLLKGAESLSEVSGKLRAASVQQQSIQSDLQKAGSTILEKEKWQREASQIRARYGQFENRLKIPSAAADIQLLRAPAQIQVIDTPKDPTRPRNSKLLIFLGGVMAAFAMAGGFAFLAEQLDTSLRSPEMLTAATGLPNIAAFASLSPSAQPSPLGRVSRILSAPS